MWNPRQSFFLRAAALIAVVATIVWISYAVSSHLRRALVSGSVRELGNVKFGQAAPDFKVADLASNQISLESYRGRKAVLLDFWATWCPPCVEELPRLQVLHDKFGGAGLEILSLDQAEPREDVLKFLADKKYTLHVLLDADGAVSQKYGVQAIPSLVLVDKSGIIQRLEVGLSDDESGLQKAIEAAVKQ